MPADSLLVDTHGEHCCVVVDGDAYSVFLKNEITGLSPVGPRLFQCAFGHAPTPPLDAIKVTKPVAIAGMKKWDAFLRKQAEMKAKKK